MDLTTSFLLNSTTGKILSLSEESFLGVGINSKENLTNKLFIAIKGKRFDGHDFLKEALSNGATGFLIHNEQKIPKELQDKTVIQVPDILTALQSLSSQWRKKLNLKIIAITGTNGKTTTKDFVKTLMPGVLSSQKSFNNQFGVPLSLLSEKREGVFFVQEIGTSNQGEIAPLCKMCDPYVSAVTMVGPAHLENFKSVEEIAKEKKQIYLASPNAIFVFNQDNAYTKKMYQELKSESCITFSSLSKTADVFFEIQKETQTDILIKGSIQNVQGQVWIPVSSINLENLMCASSLALACGVSPKNIWERLAFCKTPFGRHNWFQLENPNVSILFDAYNANPLSMKAFLEKCESLKMKRKIFILGDMKELGENSEKYHTDLASSKALQEAQLIWYIGRYGDLVEKTLRGKSYGGKWMFSEVYKKKDITELKKELQSGDFIGIKASRGIGLEKVLFDLIGKTLPL